ncbi:MAG: PqqD family protein [Eubacterium sp.]|nr:PqqD family protein [Eubacterium sp.]
MKIKDGFLLRNIAGNYVVVPIGKENIDFNGMVSLNGTGAFLFEKLQAGITEEELIQALMQEFEVSEETAKEDVKLFIQKVEKEGLFE